LVDKGFKHVAILDGSEDFIWYSYDGQWALLMMPMMMKVMENKML
jgi:hypothetical protein